MTDELDRAVEATLFAAEEPMSIAALAAHLGEAAAGDVREALRRLAGSEAGDDAGARVSVGDLFLAGILPGILMGFMLIWLVLGLWLLSGLIS